MLSLNNSSVEDLILFFITNIPDQNKVSYDMGVNSELTATMENKTVYKASKEVSNKFNPIGWFPIKEYEKTIIGLINQLVFNPPPHQLFYIFN